MAINITKEDDLVDATLTWSRDGYAGIAVVLGARTETETSLFVDVLSFPDNIELLPMWTGSPSKADKESKGSTIDAYVKYATTPDDTTFKEIDSSGGFGDPETAIFGYREILPKTEDYSQGNAKSAFSMVNDTTWKFINKVGLGTRVKPDEISYVMFQGDHGKEFEQKDNNKFCTATIKGFTRIITAGKNATDPQYFTDGEFVPFTVTVDDRYIKKQVFESYRENPDTAIVPNAIVRDDIGTMKVYADSIAENTSISRVSGSMTLKGRRYWDIGTMVESIFTDEDSVLVNLAMINIDQEFEPVDEQGQPLGDQTTVELGRS